jgi:hypothetical protein
MTHPRVAAYWHRAFNAGFLTMNPKARPSQPDPSATFTMFEWLHRSSRSTQVAPQPSGMAMISVILTSTGVTPLVQVHRLEERPGGHV